MFFSLQVGAKFVAMKTFIFMHLAQATIFSFAFHDDEMSEHHNDVLRIVRFPAAPLPPS